MLEKVFCATYVSTKVYQTYRSKAIFFKQLGDMNYWKYIKVAHLVNLKLGFTD